MRRHGSLPSVSARRSISEHRTRARRQQGAAAGRDPSQPFRSVRTTATRRRPGCAVPGLLCTGPVPTSSSATPRPPGALGIPLPSRLDRRSLRCRSPASHRLPPQASGVIGHRIRQADRRGQPQGLPLVRPAECWLELASIRFVDELVVLGDALVRRLDPLASLEANCPRCRFEARAARCRSGLRRPSPSSGRAPTHRRRPRLGSSSSGAGCRSR